MSAKFARQVGDRGTEIKAYFKIGSIYQSRSDYQQAIKFFEKSLDMAKEADDQAGVKCAQQALVESYLALGDDLSGWLVFILFFVLFLLLLLLLFLLIDIIIHSRLLNSIAKKLSILK